MKKKISGFTRCGWATYPLMQKYHDEEWGVPAKNDRKQFEFLILESAQAGLSWACILNKRENYRKAFAGFDPKKVARFNATYVKKLLNNAGIVRNRLKIESAINNAKRFLEIQKEFGSFCNYIRPFTEKIKPARRKILKDLPAATPESEALSKDMKKRGFKFLGAIVLYSHMQAVGLVNDHLVSCYRYRELTGKNSAKSTVFLLKKYRNTLYWRPQNNFHPITYEYSRNFSFLP